MKKISSIILLIALLANFNGISQSKIFDGVIDAEVRNTVEITNNKQIVGYAFFYMVDKMKKTYQNNMYTIKQLQNSKIEPIQLDEQGQTVDNLYELLSLNQTLMHKKGTKFNLPAPKFKFIINNAANVGANINGYKMFYLNNFATAVTECLNDIKQTVYDETGVNKENLESMLASKISELDKIHTDIEEQYTKPISELNSKKRNGTITILEYNKLLELSYKKKEAERTQITPLENKIFGSHLSIALA
jgi:hypothetical protein